jgi:hypothetical protein
MSAILFGKIKSEYPWQQLPAWNQPEGMIAMLEVDGHRLEIHKKPYRYPRTHAFAYQEATRPPQTFRFWLVVDGKKRGSESPRVSAILSEADAMVGWSRATAAAPASAEGGRE